MGFQASPSPGDLPDPRIKVWSPALQADSLPIELSGKPKRVNYENKINFIQKGHLQYSIKDNDKNHSYIKGHDSEDLAVKTGMQLVNMQKPIVYVLGLNAPISCLDASKENTHHWTVGGWDNSQDEQSCPLLGELATIESTFSVFCIQWKR